MEKFCSQNGPIVSCLIKKSFVKGELKNIGYGYIVFENSEDAKKFQ